MNISEIAKLAGVSPSAVSRYLNQGYLSREKREAIARVIRETGYQPLVQAQSLRTKRTQTVGVILPRIDSSAIGKVVSGLDAALEPKGFRLLLADTHNRPEKELTYLETFDRQQRVDGVILIGTVFTPRHLELIRKSRVPLVIVGQRLAGCSCVFHDDYHAFYDITRRLLDRGCRRLGYIGALPQDEAVGRERSRAYRDAVTEAGLEERSVIADFTMDSGREMAQTLWETRGPLDGLICATDNMAAGALQYLRSRGISVPGQVRLTGHGNSRLCGVTTPTLTTIRYYYEESGANAGALLLERLEDAAAPVKEIKLGYAIVEGESTQ